MDKSEPRTIREPYEPPTVEDVPIRAEEQLLAGCKPPGVGGGFDPLFCIACSLPANS